MILYMAGLAFVSTLLLTGGVRHFAIRRGLFDIPNQRSSHQKITPRGGGIAFILVFCLMLVLGTKTIEVNSATLSSILLAAMIVGGVGFLDDIKHISPRWRLLAQILTSVLVLTFMQGLPELNLMGWVIPGGVGLNLLACLYFVWLINLYNFMDGINGLAVVEAMSACLCMVVIYGHVGFTAGIGAPLLLASCLGGFLFWNFPFAKIFMGDVGSGFLGCMLGILTLQAGQESMSLFYAWLIMLGVFIVDASFTLLQRIRVGDKIYEGHRSHAYQKAAFLLNSHTPVTLIVLLINLLWLFPISFFVGTGVLNGLTGLLCAYSPLIYLAYRLKAGVSKG